MKNILHTHAIFISIYWIISLEKQQQQIFCFMRQVLVSHTDWYLVIDLKVLTFLIKMQQISATSYWHLHNFHETSVCLIKCWIHIWLFSLTKVAGTWVGGVDGHSKFCARDRPAHFESLKFNPCAHISILKGSYKTMRYCT